MKKRSTPLKVKPEALERLDKLELRVTGIELGIDNILEKLGAKTEHNTEEAKPILQSPVQSPTFSDTEGLYVIHAGNVNDIALERFASYKWLLGKIVVLKNSAKEDVPILSWDEVRDAAAIVKVIVLKITRLGIVVDIGVEFNFDLRVGNSLNGYGAVKRCLWISGDNYEVYC